MKRLIFLLTAVLLINFINSSLLLSAVIEGIVLSENGPIEGSKVYAYTKFQDIKNGTPAFSSIPGENKGFFKIELSPGTYYLLASGQVDGKDFFSYHGANPIKIEDKKLWIPFMTVPKITEIMKESSSAKLSGKVLFKGSPVKASQVSIYPLTESTFRGMGFLTSTTDDNGLFSMSTEPGEYVVIARKRNNYNGMRPLEKGDLFCYFAGNPLTIEDLRETYLEIPCYPKDDLKAFLNENAYPAILVKKSGEDSVRFRENKPEKTAHDLKIKGRTTDLQGNPMKNLYVMAYRGKAPEMFQMHYVRTMPDYMVKTDEKGYYSIDGVEKGLYYMVARELIGVAPVKGEYYGLFEGNAHHAVEIENDMENINIMVSRVMGKTSQESWVRSQESNPPLPPFTKGGRGGINFEVRNHTYSEDTVIKTDTGWSGDIVINGTVHVARGVTLSIAPGTVIKFRKFDKNGDGTGDAMITVGGKLTARGTSEKMIRFTSYEEKPDKRDWSYVLLFVSGDESIIEYCIFEYAFTGVQVHFSNSKISDSVFTKNYEGLRFGRAGLGIRHNDIFGNNYGIRHTRIEEPVDITYNNITNNDVGIFLVPSNQNVVDFSSTFDKKGFFPGKQFIARYNNISYNREYNYRMGEREGFDILIRDNWWGSNNEKNILDSIYDEKADSSLGSVVYKPYFTSPVKNAGMRKKGAI